jgi:N6-L-threonylcarbamoyladenine synthase
MLHSKDLDFSFSGLKTSVLTTVRSLGASPVCEQVRADIARAFQEAIVEVLVAKSVAALKQTRLKTLVVAGGVGANQYLREQMNIALGRRHASVHFPELQWCTDNGAMIALAAALRFEAGIADASTHYGFAVRPRWDLAELARR